MDTPSDNIPLVVHATLNLCYGLKMQHFLFVPCLVPTGFSSEIGTKLRESAVGQAGGSCYSRAALSSNDSKTLYRVNLDIG